MGERLQRLRHAAGLSQSQLARATGIPVGSIKNWEQGLRTPRVPVLVPLARALGVSVETLLAAAAPKKPRRRKEG